MTRNDRTIPCPHCGEEISETAGFCRHCGSSDDDGWSDDDDISDDFDYEEFVAENFPTNRISHVRPLWRWVAVLVLAAFVLSFVFQLLMG